MVLPLVENNSGSRRRIAGFLTGLIIIGFGVLIGVGLFVGAVFVKSMKTSLAEYRQGNEPIDISLLTNELNTKQNGLADLNSSSSEFSREVALYEKLSDADLDDLTQLLNESNSITSDIRRRNARVIIFRRMAEIDPRRALDHIDSFQRVEQEAFVDGIFKEWSHSDLRAAVRHAKTLKRHRKLIALAAILRTRDELPEVERRTIGLELGTEQQVNAILNVEMTSERIHEHGSEEAWNHVTRDSVSDALQLETLMQIAEAGIAEEGLGFISRFVESYSDWEDPAIVLRVLHDAVFQSIYADPLSAFRDSMNIPGGAGDLVRETALKTWATTEPVDALQAASTFEPKEVRRSLQRVVLRAWVEADPLGILGQLNLVPREFRAFVRERAVDGFVAIPAVKAVQLLKDPANRLLSENYVNRFVQLWLYKDGEAALNWVLTEPAIEEMRHSVLGNVLVRLAMRDPERALDIAIQHPKVEKQEWESDLEITVIKSVLQVDIEKALNLISRVSDENRYESYWHIGRALVERREFDSALNLAEFVPDSKRTEFEYEMVLIWASYDWKELFNHLNELPAHIQSRAARIVISHNQRKHLLSEQDRLYTRSLLNEEDLEFISNF